MTIRACIVDDQPAVRWGRQGVAIPYGPRVGRSHGEALALARMNGRRLAARRLLHDRDCRGDARGRPIASRSRKPRFSDGITTAYEGMLHARVGLMERMVLEYAGPAIEEAQRELDARRRDANAWAEVQRILRIVRDVITKGSDEDGFRHLAQEVEEDVTDSTDRELSRLFNIPLATAAGSQEKVDRWIRENIGLVKSITGSGLDDLEKLVAAAAGGGTPTLDLRAQIQARFQVTYSKASFLARDQTAKLGSTIGRELKQRYGIKSYQWSTSGDARVRQEHAELDGQIFLYSAPPIADLQGNRGHPGMLWQCRCDDIAVMPDDDVNALLAEAEARQERELLILQASPTVQGEIKNRSGFSDWNAARIAALKRGTRSAVGL